MPFGSFFFSFSFPFWGKILKSEAPGSEKRNLPSKVQNTRLFWRRRRRMLFLLSGAQIRSFLMRIENFYPYKFFVRPYCTLSENSLKYCPAQKIVFFGRRGQYTAPSQVKRTIYLLRLPCAEKANSESVLHETFVSFSWKRNTNKHRHAHASHQYQPAKIHICDLSILT